MAITLSPRQRAQYDELSMAEKIAILLVQLGDEITSEIFHHLDIDSITEVSKQIAQLGGMDKTIGAAVLEEFYVIFQSNQYINSGGMDYARDLLIKSLGPDAAKAILDKLAKQCSPKRTLLIFQRFALNNLQTLLLTSTLKQSRLFSHIWTQAVQRRLWGIFLMSCALK